MSYTSCVHVWTFFCQYKWPHNVKEDTISHDHNKVERTISRCIEAIYIGQITVEDTSY